PARPGPQRTAKRADHAGGYRALEAERIADGDDQLAHADDAGIAELRMRKAVRMQSQDGEIAVGIVAHQVGRERPAIGPPRPDRAGAVHDMAVGENEAVWR